MWGQTGRLDIQAEAVVVLSSNSARQEVEKSGRVSVWAL